MKLKQLVKDVVHWSPLRCVCCGVRVRRRHSTVIWDELAEQWSLTREQRRLVDQREGRFCPSCGVNWRIAQLAQVLLEDVGQRTGRRHATIAKMVRDPSVHPLKVAEINGLAGLHDYLRVLPGLVYSEYGGENSQDLMALSYGDGTFDYLLTSDTLEHVPDFDRALGEIRRVLRPGGKHIFTIPVIWDRVTRRRAEMIDGQIVHHLPPSHHGTLASSPDDYLVFNEFGCDVVKRIDKAGFAVELHRARTNPMVVTIVAEKL